MVTNRLGRGGSRWNRLRNNLKAQQHPCWLCNQPIDYTLTWPDPHSFSVDHIRPLSTYPPGAEDPSNLRASHLACNSSRQTNDPKPGLGELSRQW